MVSFDNVYIYVTCPSVSIFSLKCCPCSMIWNWQLISDNIKYAAEYGLSQYLLIARSQLIANGCVVTTSCGESIIIMSTSSAISAKLYTYQATFKQDSKCGPLRPCDQWTHPSNWMWSTTVHVSGSSVFGPKLNPHCLAWTSTYNEPWMEIQTRKNSDTRKPGSGRTLNVFMCVSKVRIVCIVLVSGNIYSPVWVMQLSEAR